MMRGSNGGGQEVTAEQLEPFRGLVFKTARMFAGQVRREEEDLMQELWIIVWKAVRSYDTTRSKICLERHVFGCITNKIRDYKRDAAREHDRREKYGLSFLHIEDMRLASRDNTALDRGSQQEAFDGRFNFVDRDEVYGRIEGGLFELPATLTDTEAKVLLFLMIEMSKPEIMLRLTLTRAALDACLVSLREKFADWRPDVDVGQRECTAPAVRTEAELVGSRAA